ncbi:hypothetical protein JW823_03220 [bacterium]|nr:hypothetical protein [candidate division CSSED10-310 bacterium]
MDYDEKGSRSMSSYNRPDCRSCGESLDQTEGFGVALCRNCGKKNLVIQASDLQELEIRETVSDADARRRAVNHLVKDRTVDSGFLRVFEEESESNLYFVPFWESEGISVVRFRTKKFRELQLLAASSDSGSQRYRRAPVTRVDPKSVHYDTKIQFQEFRHLCCAVADLDWGMDDFRIHDEMQKIFADPGEMRKRGVVISRTVPRDVLDRQHELVGARDVEASRDVVIRTDRLIYIPVWRLSVTFEGALYEAFVEAGTGRCLKANAPQSLRNRATVFSINFALTAFISSGVIVLGYRFFCMLSSDVGWVLQKLDLILFLISLPVTILMIVLAALAGLGWDRLRYRSEVIMTGDRILVHATGKFEDSWLNRLYDRTLDFLSKQLEGIVDIHE